MSIKWKGDRLGILETRRHYSNYFRGVSNFKPYRTRLVTGDTTKEVMNVFKELKEKQSTFEFMV
jgi:hypothetical protein